MRFLLLVASLTAGLLASGALAEEASAPFGQRLADLMLLTQLRHIKLWYAGQLKNWDLANYELVQIKASLADAAQLYQDIPVEYVSATADPIKAMTGAIAAKDSGAFQRSFKDLTAACNSCHRQIGRPFVVIQVPTSSPFSDQSFGPHS